jgi:hypothetical protein
VTGRESPSGFNLFGGADAGIRKLEAWRDDQAAETGWGGGRASSRLRR